MEEYDEQELAAQALQLAQSEEEEEEEEKTGSRQLSKKRLPEPVTIPKTGPLVLKASSKLHRTAHSTKASRHEAKRFTAHFDDGLPPTTNRPRHSLTRFPVVMLQRPIEQIDSDLGRISCAELTDNIQLLSERPSRHTLPHLHPMMLKHSVHRFHGNQALATPTLTGGLESFTHRDHRGPINVSITYSRHSHRPLSGAGEGGRRSAHHHRSLTYPVATPSSWLLSNATVQPHPQVKHGTVLQPARENSARYDHTSSERQKTTALAHTTRLGENHSSTTRNWPVTRDTTRATHKLPPPPPPTLPLSGQPARLVPSFSSPHAASIAPASVRAVVLHRAQPVTAATMLRGRAIQPVLAPGGSGSGGGGGGKGTL